MDTEKTTELAKTEELNYGIIKKGESIPVSELERITGFSKSDVRYSFAVMQICQKIETAKRAKGENCLARMRDYQVRVFTDEEANYYLADKFESHKAGLFRTHRYMKVVNTVGFDTEQKQFFRDNLARQASILSGVIAAEKQLMAG